MAVKLSDNPLKAVGPPREVDRYKRVFNVSGQRIQELVV